MEKKIIVYTDGSALSNGKKNSACGWAYKLIWGRAERLASGGTTGETNNRMEMTAVIDSFVKFWSGTYGFHPGGNI